MALLWGRGRPSTRGPRQGLSVEAVVKAAIELADQEGLDAVSMRRVAQRLDVGTMSLYTYVPAKAELLDLMLDSVYGGLAQALNEEPAAAGDWRAGLEARARAGWGLYRSHPWMLQVATARSVLGPNELALYEVSLRVVADIGLTGREMVSVVTSVSMFVRGAAREAAEVTQAAAATGVTNDEWWLAREPLLSEMIDPDRFPTITAVEKAGGFEEPEGTVDYLLQFAIDDFEFGLARLLDGIGAFIERRRSDSR
jgi:AcrR family transcriptional regulator